jgi:predicted lipoprotein with Yx(FWY)xxD motif
MRPSRHLTAAPRLSLRTAAPVAVLSAALCLAAVACRGPAASAGGAYGTTTAAAPTTMTPAPRAAPARALLTVRKTGAGYVLATSTGRTIYWFSGDMKGSGKSTCAGTCLAAWPAVAGAPMAAPGVQLAGELGTITRPGGVVQATYNGYPLYTYAQDMAPGETTGNGVTGAWHVITGAVLSPSPASAAAASLRDASPAASATPTGTSSGYGGY